MNVSFEQAWEIVEAYSSKFTEIYDIGDDNINDDVFDDPVDYYQRVMVHDAVHIACGLGVRPVDEELVFLIETYLCSRQEFAKQLNKSTASRKLVLGKLRLLKQNHKELYKVLFRPHWSRV